MNTKIIKLYILFVSFRPIDLDFRPMYNFARQIISTHAFIHQSLPIYRITTHLRSKLIHIPFRSTIAPWQNLKIEWKEYQNTKMLRWGSEHFSNLLLRLQFLEDKLKAIGFSRYGTNSLLVIQRVLEWSNLSPGCRTHVFSLVVSGWSFCRIFSSFLWFEKHIVLSDHKIAHLKIF